MSKGRYSRDQADVYSSRFPCIYVLSSLRFLRLTMQIMTNA